MLCTKAECMLFLYYVMLVKSCSACTFSFLIHNLEYLGTFIGLWQDLWQVCDSFPWLFPSVLVISWWVFCLYLHCIPPAGMTAVICTYPLDVIRARLAFQVTGEHRYTGIRNAFQTIYLKVWRKRKRVWSRTPLCFPFTWLCFIFKGRRNHWILPGSDPHNHWHGSICRLFLVYFTWNVQYNMQNWKTLLFPHVIVFSIFQDFLFLLSVHWRLWDWLTFQSSWASRLLTTLMFSCWRLTSICCVVESPEQLLKLYRMLISLNPLLFVIVFFTTVFYLS